MNNQFSIIVMSSIMVLCSSTVIIQQKSLSPTMTMRQSMQFRSFTDLNRRTTRRRGRPFKPIDLRCDLESPFRTLNGTCNNIRDPARGAADTPFRLIATPIEIPFPNTLPNPRMISNIVCEEAVPVPNERGMSELVTFFGQLLDHTVTEIVLTEKGAINIQILEDDMVFNKSQVIPTTRSEVEGEGAKRSPRNALSSYIDASSIYSVVEAVAKQLREFKGGRLRLPDGLLIKSKEGLFISGDERANENPNLTALHLLFSREHNEVASVIADAFPAMNDEEIYQLARAVVIAEFQAITFFEFLPALTGRTLPKYPGYDQEEFAVISNSFSTVAFRVGHTLLNTTVTSISDTGEVRDRPLRDSFFNPIAFVEDTIDGLFRGLMSGFASEVDAGITGEVRNFLMNEGEEMQLDLAALNIQRGRDHGVPRYNALRTFYGLRRLTSFSQITSNINLQRKLEVAYNLDIDAVDPWVGGISEDRKVGSFGELFARIWLREFQRLRNGDRFYFERPGLFTDEQISNIPMLAKVVGPNRKLGGIMRDVIIRNTNIPPGQVNPNPFFV